MLILLQPTTSIPQWQFPSLEALLDEPFPRTPEDMMRLEQRLAIEAMQVAGIPRKAGQVAVDRVL